LRRSGERKKRFFFEKKNQKTFASLGPAPSGKAAANDQKFFASFFQKRRACLSGRDCPARPLSALAFLPA
jgi:hypothetical protein